MESNSSDIVCDDTIWVTNIKQVTSKRIGLFEKLYGLNFFMITYYFLVTVNFQLGVCVYFCVLPAGS